MTGHQAEFWHPGILAKYVAADAAARAFGASPAWVVVDQADPAANTVVPYPFRGADGALAIESWDVSGAPPTGRATTVRERRETAIPDFVRTGLDRIASVWAAHADQPAPARRLSAALADLIAPLIPPAPAVFATDLARTDLFRALIEAMRRDPAPCIAAHNAAARAHPSARIRPLVADEVQDRFELPLWHIAPGSARRRVYAEMLGSIPPRELAPRAVLLTGILRLAACDLFIHGTGGGGDEGVSTRDRPPMAASHEGYERVTEDWLTAWARSDRAIADLLAGGLAPMAVVTATRLLPLAADPVPTEADVARDRWRAHHARHDPGLLRDAPAAAQKRELVSAIEAAPRRSRERSDLYARLHTTLDQARRAHAPDLEALARRADHARARRADAAIAHDRTWPFPIYPEPMLLALRDEIRAAFGATASPPQQ